MRDFCQTNLARGSLITEEAVTCINRMARCPPIANSHLGQEDSSADGEQDFSDGSSQPPAAMDKDEVGHGSEHGGEDEDERADEDVASSEDSDRKWHRLHQDESDWRFSSSDSEEQTCSWRMDCESNCRPCMAAPVRSGNAAEEQGGES